jgi:hypothetical protein
MKAAAAWDVQGSAAGVTASAPRALGRLFTELPRSQIRRSSANLILGSTLVWHAAKSMSRILDKTP